MLQSSHSIQNDFVLFILTVFVFVCFCWSSTAAVASADRMRQWKWRHSLDFLANFLLYSSEQCCVRTHAVVGVVFILRSPIYTVAIHFSCHSFFNWKLFDSFYIFHFSKRKNIWAIVTNVFSWKLGVVEQLSHFSIRLIGQLKSKKWWPSLAKVLATCTHFVVSFFLVFFFLLDQQRFTEEMPTLFQFGIVSPLKDFKILAYLSLLKHFLIIIIIIMIWNRKEIDLLCSVVKVDQSRNNRRKKMAICFTTVVTNGRLMDDKVTSPSRCQCRCLWRRRRPHVALLPKKEEREGRSPFHSSARERFEKRKQKGNSRAFQRAI